MDFLCQRTCLYSDQRETTQIEISYLPWLSLIKNVQCPWQVQFIAHYFFFKLKPSSKAFLMVGIDQLFTFIHLFISHLCGRCERLKYFIHFFFAFLTAGICTICIRYTFLSQDPWQKKFHMGIIVLLFDYLWNFIHSNVSILLHRICPLLVLSLKRQDYVSVDALLIYKFQYNGSLLPKWTTVCVHWVVNEQFLFPWACEMNCININHILGRVDKF